MIVKALVLREQLRSFYGKYSRYIDFAVRFAVAFAAFFALGKSLGFLKILANPLVEILLAVLCGLLPWSSVSFFSGAVMLGHLAALSPEVCVTAAGILLLMFCAYYVFMPGNSIILVLMPLLFALRIPYVMPVCVGLLCGPLSAVPVGFGVLLSYLIRYVHANVALLRADSDLGTLQRFIQIITYLRDAKAMWLTAAVFVLVVIMVWTIRRQSFSHAWRVAIFVGGAFCAAAMLGGIYALRINSVSVGWIIGGCILAVLLGLLLEFLLFAVDYTRAEYTQFEDDTYYYYVKAVPKFAVQKADVTVKKITGRRGEKDEDTAGPAPQTDIPEAKAFEEDVFEGKTADLVKTQQAVKELSREEALAKSLESKIERELEDIFVESVSGTREIGGEK